MDEDPQSSCVPGTDLSSSHSLALRDDGACLVTRQGKKELGEKMEWNMMQPLSTGFYPLGSRSILSPDPGETLDSSCAPCTCLGTRGRKIPFFTHSLMLLFRTGMGGTGKEGRLSWCSSRALLFSARPAPGTLT